jgi:hypothetical protein
MKRIAWIILGAAIFLGALRSYSYYQNSSPTPYDAVKDYLTRIMIRSNSSQKIESLNVVSTTASHRKESEQLLLFQVQTQKPDLQTHWAGYATIQKNLSGWQVDQFQMVGNSSPEPTDIMAGFGWSDGIPIVYGQVFVMDAASVEVVFSDPQQGNVISRAGIAHGSFAVFGTPNSEVTILKILDVNGNILKQLTYDELQDK